MKKELTATEALAKNLQTLMDQANGGEGISQTKLAKAAEVAQTSIGYMLHPQKRAPSGSGKPSSPTLESVEKVAKFFGKEAWQLIHPRPGEAPLNPRERAMYEEAMASISRLRAIANTK